MAQQPTQNKVVPMLASLGKLMALLFWLGLASHAQAGAIDATRIVSVGGDVTEILFALGLGDNVVAVDTTSQYPAVVRNKKSVGYMRALSTEGVLSTRPTLILATKHAGPPDVVKALKESNVTYVEVAGPESAEGIAAKIRAVAKTTGKIAAGEKLAEKIVKDFRELAVIRAKHPNKVRALFVLSAQSSRAVVGGRQTGADAMLRLAGAENVAADISGYKPLSSEAALTLAPEVIVTMKARHGEETDIRSVPGLAASPAVKNNRIIALDGSYLLQFGPRAASAARDLMDDLHAVHGH